jgi:hypothetical protein
MPRDCSQDGDLFAIARRLHDRGADRDEICLARTAALLAGRRPPLTRREALMAERYQAAARRHAEAVAT